MLDILALGMWRRIEATYGGMVTFSMEQILSYANVDEKSLTWKERWILGNLLGTFAKRAGCEKKYSSRGIRVICSKAKMPLGNFDEFKKYLDEMITEIV